LFGAQFRSEGIDPYDTSSMRIDKVVEKIEEAYADFRRIFSEREARQRQKRNTEADQKPVSVDDHAHEIVFVGLRAMGLETRGLLDSERQRVKRAR
jgi:hypothetical protein